MIAALFVQPGGAYFNQPGIDPWDEARDARNYSGPYPVIAHPPCARWCRLAGLVEARLGYKRGEDGGCFKSALESVRAYGGVLEHPAYSDAWAVFGLPRPNRLGGWTKGVCGGYTCHVEQGRYGHRAKKATWLYTHGIPEGYLPALRWGSSPNSKPTHLVGWLRNRSNPNDTRPRLGKKEASATPSEFKAVLITLANSAKRE